MAAGVTAESGVGSLGELLAQPFVAKHFSGQSKNDKEDHIEKNYEAKGH